MLHTRKYRCADLDTNHFLVIMKLAVISDIRVLFEKGKYINKAKHFTCNNLKHI